MDDSLSEAIYSHNIDRVRTLLENKANPNENMENMNITPLIQAVHSGEIQSVKLLLEAKANTFGTNDIGDTAFHTAVQLGETNILRLLCSYILHGEVNILHDIRGESPLTDAIIWKNVDCANILLDHGAIYNMRETKEWFTTLLISRRRCVSAARAFYGVLKFRLGVGPDMVRLLTRLIWDTRTKQYIWK